MGSIVGPERGGVSSGVAVGFGGEAMTFGAEQGGDLVMGGEESLGLAGRLEPRHDLFSSSRVPMRGLGPIVQPLMGTVVGTGAILARGDVVALELVGHHHARHTPVAHEFSQEPLGGTRISPALDQDFQHIAPAVDGAPEPRPLAREIVITTSSRYHLSDA